MQHSALSFDVSDLPHSVSTRLAHAARRFHLSAVGSWENHCEHCGTAVGEEQLHRKIGGFVPGDEPQAAAVRLVRVDEPFTAAAAGYSMAPEFLDHRQRG